LPIAAQALRQSPHDAEIRFLASAHAARLGLRTIAQDTLSPLRELESPPDEVGAMAEAIRRLGDDTIAASDLIARLETNLKPLDGRGIDIGSAARDWADRAPGRPAFRTLDGHVVFVEPGDEPWVPAHDLTRVTPLVEARAAARELAASLRVKRSDYPSPIIVEGLALPWALREIYDASPPGPTGCRQRLIAIEPDPAALCDGLAVADLADVLADDRVTLLNGPDAGEQLRGWLMDRADRRLPSGVIVTQGSEQGAGSSARDVLHRTREALDHALARARDAIGTRARARDLCWWADRYARALDGTGPPLRVLIPTCRYSTYVQHAARDVALAFRDQGHEAEVLIEPDDTCTLSALAYARAAERLDPDLVILINYPRRAMGEGKTCDNVPFVCWVQDAMPHLFDDEFGVAQGPLDFVVGSVHWSMVDEFGYPLDRCLFLNVPASSSKFAGPRRARGGGSNASEALECDMLIASNHGESPDELARRFENECVRSGAPAGLAMSICGAMRELIDEWREGWLACEIQDRVEPILARYGARGSGAVDAIARSIARPFVNRLLRHRLATWAAELAEEHGLRLRIHGHGWERSGRFASYARGPLEHGEALRRAYASAGVTLHVSSECPQHQRLHECAMSGGLPAVMLTPGDLPFMFHNAGRHACDNLIATHARLADRRHCVAAIDDPVTALSLALAQRVPGWKRVPTDADRHRPERALEDGLIIRGDGSRDAPSRKLPGLIDEIEHIRFMWAISEAMFTTREEMLDVAIRARDDRAWREARSRHAASFSERSFSYERCARGVLEFVVSGLRRAAAGEAEDHHARPAA